MSSTNSIAGGRILNLLAEHGPVGEPFLLGKLVPRYVGGEHHLRRVLQSLVLGGLVVETAQGFQLNGGEE